MLVEEEEEREFEVNVFRNELCCGFCGEDGCG